MQAVAVLSMLHELRPPRAGGRACAARDSASRLFRGQPVLAWTLSRLSRAKRLSGAVIICWEEQHDAVRSIARETGADVIVRGPRAATPSIDSVSAALRWADGWRGGLIGATSFDRGFSAPAVSQAMSDAHADAAVLIDPSAGVIDAGLVDALIAQAEEFPEIELFFSQAAPGLCGAVVRAALVERMSASLSHPGRLLSYWPDTPGRDPITTDSCLAVPPAVARTLHRFTLDSDRQIRRLTAATEDLNGSLISTDARGLVAVLDACPDTHPLPRDITLEINSTRATRPIFAAGTQLSITRGDMSLDTLRHTLEQFAGADDLRLTLAGAGDPALHPRFSEITKMLAESDIPAIHVETDLVDLSEDAIEAMARGRFDLISIHLPALTQATYQRVMGVDRIEQVVRNLAQLTKLRGGNVPIIVPTFTKCRENLDEMEAWYDQFLRAVGVAVIAGPSDFAGQIPDHACADMSPPRRRPCQRIGSRMTILSDGRIPACEQDALALHPVAELKSTSIPETWRSRLQPLRDDHQSGTLTARPLCLTCKEWHRP